MSNIVYLLWFVQEHDQTRDTELLIGVYDSEDSAKKAIGGWPMSRRFCETWDSLGEA